MTVVTGIPVSVPRVKVTVEPAVEPIPLDDIKTHLRVTGTADDGYLAGLLISARRWIEQQTDRALVTQTRTLTLDAFPSADYIELPGGPLQSITSIVYTKEDATTATFSASKYHTDTAKLPGRAYLKVDQEWPDDDLIATGGVVVTYVAGDPYYTSTATITIATPAVVTWTAHGLSNGAPVSFTTTGALPTGVTAERTYYVVGSAANSFSIAAAPGGSSIATSGTQSGTHTATSTWRVPRGLIHAIKLLVGHWYEHRESVMDQAGGNLQEVPQALSTLLETDKLWGFA